MFNSKLEGEALEGHRKGMNELYRLASEQLKVPRSELVARPLRPDDIGPTVAGSTQDYRYGQTATAWDTIINGKTIDDGRFIMINGVYIGGTIANGPAVPIEQIRFTCKGSDVAYWETTPIGNFESKTGYIDQPIIVGQNQSITVKTWGRSASSIVDWAILGMVVEQRGLLINP